MSSKTTELVCTECGDKFTVASKAVWSYKKKGTLCKECTVGPGSVKYRSLYSRYQGMIQRCYNINRKEYIDYGARGITVCDEWREDKQAFFTWAKANGYAVDKQLDKDIGSKELGISPGIYSPETCRFTTKTINSQATRKLRKHNTSGYRGVSYNKEEEVFVASIIVEGKPKYLTKNKYPVPCAIAYDNYVDTHDVEHTKNELSGVETRAYYQHKRNQKEEKALLKQQLKLKNDAANEIKAIEQQLADELYPLNLKYNRLVTSIEVYDANVKKS